MADEVVSLNALDLDIQEIERRVELAGLLPNADCWDFTCGTNTCNLNCSTFGI